MKWAIVTILMIIGVSGVVAFFLMVDAIGRMLGEAPKKGRGR